MAHDVMTIRPAWTAPASTRKTVTPLYGAHRSFGAHFGEYAGMTMPMRYAGESAEVRAVRRTAGLFDLCYLGEIAVTGRDAAAMLDYALTGCVTSLEIGRARYSMMCDAGGGILEDLVVARVDAAEYVIISNTTDVDVLIKELTVRGERFAARVDDRTEDYAVMSVEGPKAAAILGALTPVDIRALRYFECVETTVAGRNGMLARTGYTGDDAVEFYCAPDDAAAVWYALADAGVPHGIQPAGLDARALLRLEAGVPLCGRELTPAITPFDVRLGALVDLTKPDFVGKSALAARAGRETERGLFGLTAEGRRAPRAGQAVLDARTGGHVGIVTSGGFSPTLGHPVAMAILEAPALAAAVELVVEAGDLLPVSLASLPFRGRRRRH